MRISRRILLAASALPAVWLGFFLSGYNIVLTRQVTTTAAAEAMVVCRYLHATGTREMMEFMAAPDAVPCPQVLAARTFDERREGHWAAAIPGNRPVAVVCRFVRRPTDGSGLAQRFAADSPLRLSIHLSAGIVDVADDDARTLLGPGEPNGPGAIAAHFAWLSFQHGGLPIFDPTRTARLTLTIDPAQGHARLILAAADPHVLWVRDGGCRMET